MSSTRSWRRRARLAAGELIIRRLNWRDCHRCSQQPPVPGHASGRWLESGVVFLRVISSEDYLSKSYAPPAQVRFGKAGPGQGGPPRRRHPADTMRRPTQLLAIAAATTAASLRPYLPRPLQVAIIGRLDSIALVPAGREDGNGAPRGLLLGGRRGSACRPQRCVVVLAGEQRSPPPTLRQPAPVPPHPAAVSARVLFRRAGWTTLSANGSASPG